jgi:predicted membrane protein
VLPEHHHGLKLTTAQQSERGEGRFKAILFTAIFVFFIYSAVKIIPPYVNNYQIADKMQETARFAVVNRYDEEKVRDVIFKEVQDLEIPVKREEIKVVANVSVVKISLDYTVPIDLLFYHFDLHFTPSSENKSLT